MPKVRPVPTPDLITTKVAAEILAVDHRTVTRWVDAGKLREVAKGAGVRGARFFARSDVEALRRERVADLEAQLSALTETAS